MLFNALYDRYAKTIRLTTQPFYHYVKRPDSAMQSHHDQRLLQQMSVFGKIQKAYEKEVSDQTLCVLFWMHLISGLNQSKKSGQPISFYASTIHKTMARFPYLPKVRTRALVRFLQNEKASFLGKMRLSLANGALTMHQYRLFAIIMGM